MSSLLTPEIVLYNKFLILHHQTMSTKIHSKSPVICFNMYLSIENAEENFLKIYDGIKILSDTYSFEELHESYSLTTNLFAKCVQ